MSCPVIRVISHPPGSLHLGLPNLGVPWSYAAHARPRLDWGDGGGPRGAPGPLRGRLAELGLREGASIQVVQRTAGGGRIVGIAGTRLALGAEVLDFLAVSEVSS